MNAKAAMKQDFDDAHNDALARAAPPRGETKGGADAPARPPSNDDITAMMAAAKAAEKARREKQRARRRREGGEGFWQTASFWLLWGGVAVAFAAILMTLFSARAATGPGLVLAAGAALLAMLLFAGAAMQMLSPILLASVLRRRAGGKDRAGAVQLAGADMLRALRVAEGVLDADPDARLITRRDGVVAYANPAYFALAREAGVIGPAGLPPRIDRLFAQQGAETTKVFRLCRAAKSAAPAEEIIYQRIGLKSGGRRRRFEVSVHPIPDCEDHVSWRLRELPIEEEDHDALAAAYADYLRPVFAIERSGQIAWSNAAMRKALGAARGGLDHIDDIILGETGELIRALWRVDQTPQKARVRRRGADPAEGRFTAFRRGGVGEGFVCVELAVDDPGAFGEDEFSLSGDISEAPFGVAMIEGEIGRDARVVEANKTFAEAFGASKRNAPLSKAFPQKVMDDLAAEIRRRANAASAPRTIEAAIGTGAAARCYALYARPVRRRRGAYGSRRTLLYSVDISERKMMEQDYAQDQKLKAIGHLAGTVAHDFNNLLQVVLGNCELLMLRHPAGDPSYQELVLVRENAQRAANMTKQLLAYSRKQTLQPEILSITEVLRDFARFLDRAIGEKVKLNLVNGRGLPEIKADRRQLETAIMNLAVNARDAIAPEGGVLTIRTKAMSAEDVKATSLPGLSEQDHLLIEVSDTGPGVPEEIADKIFDPFFTTKDVGKGTGLGLSTVHGVIGQMGGKIFLDNTDGGGAVFRIYLPARLAVEDEEPEEIVAAEPVPGAVADVTGAGRVLVVEDEDPVRSFVVNTLERCGYEVTEAEDGDEALEILAEDADGFDLIISDVMMPEVDGPTLIERARARSHAPKAILFMSAYAETTVREQLNAIEGAAYIQKPFSLNALATRVKELLTPDEADETA
ncbi:MAG: ATP-binding protein [Parvularculaceae bacterium]